MVSVMLNASYVTDIDFTTTEKVMLEADSPNLKVLKKEKEHAENQKLEIGEKKKISFGFGASVGSIFAGIFIDKFGRRSTIIMTSIIYFLGYTLLIIGCPELQNTAGFSNFFTVFGCIYAGVGVGMTSLVVPVYIAEVSSARLRGTMGAITNHAIVFGMFLYSLTAELSNWTIKYYYSAIVGLVVILLSFLMIFMPETPRWLLADGQRKKAFKNQLWLLGNKSDAEDECNNIEINLAHQQIASVNDFRSPGLFRPLIIGSLLFLIHQFILIGYITYLSDLLGHFTQKKYIIIICFTLQFILSLVGCFIVNKFYRRHLLLFGSTSLFIFSIVFAVFARLIDTKTGKITYLIIYAVIFILIWGSLPWIIVSEIFPPRARGLLGVS
ncbi:solute carrier family 2, facilitated glucose transporter member 8 isoform X2 [Hydra vulgaris]|uniref:Solute carrier family 2, facilitated glucose transporter member 8 isoform X2 n=1 Tax=Hydra vulgaris TaxID=6087 RepID=A0ABM4B1Q7_HYDVU